MTIAGSRSTDHRDRADYHEMFHAYLGPFAARAYHARNRWMVDRSALVIGFPHGNDPLSGTWFTLNYAADQGRARLIVPV